MWQSREWEATGYCRAERIGFLREPIDEARPWHDILRDYVNAFGQSLEEYPGFAHTILTNPGAHSHVQGYLRRLTDALAASDFPGDHDDIMFAIDFMGDITLVTHLGIVPLREATSSGEKGLVALILRSRQLCAAHKSSIGSIGFPSAPFPSESSGASFIIAAIEAGIGLGPSPTNPS